MGLFKDMRNLSKAGKEASAGHDPVAQMRQASAQMQQMTAQSTVVTHGVPAQAVVVGLRDTGMLVNHQPVVEVDTTVLPTGGPAYPATASVHGHAPLAMLQPGTVVQVRYDPADPTTVAIG